MVSWPSVLHAQVPKLQGASDSRPECDPEQAGVQLTFQEVQIGATFAPVCSKGLPSFSGPIKGTICCVCIV